MEMTMFGYERDYWNSRYSSGGNSGAGSDGEMMMRKVDALASLPDINSIVEIGVGDFNFGKHLVTKLPYAKYDGYDVSDVIVERNRKNFKTWSPRIEFHELPIQGLMTDIPKSDLLICIDVLFHIIDDDEYTLMLTLLRERFWKGRYLAVTAYEYDGPSGPHLRIRRFDPSVFGEPILQETIEEDGNLQFYVWKS